MDTVLLAVGFGALIGVLLGMIGGGGSILTVPILVYLLGASVHEATATSLIIVGATALFGAVPHARAGRVAPATALLFGAAGIGGAFLGAALNARVSGPVILLLFGLLMIGVAARMTFGGRPAERAPNGGRNARFWGRVVASGLLVGVMTGFFGVGGGFLIVPALVLVLGLPMRLAVGTSLVIIVITSGAGILAHLRTGGMDVPLALLFIVGGFAGANLGSRLAGRVDERKLSRAFAALVAVLGAYLVIRNGTALA